MAHPETLKWPRLSLRECNMVAKTGAFTLAEDPVNMVKKKKGESNDIGLSNSLTQSGKLAELNMFSYPVLW